MSVLFKDKITGLWKRAAANLIYASFPVGSIVAYGGSSDVDAPAGCMYCHGQVLNANDYPDLYDVIGTKFGVGDGSPGSFSLPELRGEFLRGAGTNQHSGEGSGGSVGTHQGATSIPSYAAGAGSVVFDSQNNTWTYISNADKNTEVSGGSTYLYNSGGYVAGTGRRYSMRPTNMSVEYIIKVVK